ncbi:hypothetical protein SteCoe_36475 [Stentor coeruleus]|uniref:Uncharacterized protein n=1 Tax=Stentor coeruleus TaxID=5963 RepID=A0A1R2AQ06_9CILI|nr:hypothetical protein SteCoe_36475 [Stentor coeruleus]
MLNTQMYLLSLLILAYSTVILKNFSEILLTPNTVMDFNYLDYFEGTQLHYFVKKSSSSYMQHPQPDIVKGEYSLKWPESSISREMGSFFNYSNSLSYYFSKKFIGCINVNANTANLNQVWIKEIDSTKPNLNIIALAVLDYKKQNYKNYHKKKSSQSQKPTTSNLSQPLYSNTTKFNTSQHFFSYADESNAEHFLLVIAQDTVSLINEFYVSEITNSSKTAIFTSIKIPQLSNINQLSLYHYFPTEIVSFAGCEGNTSYDFIYNFSDIYEPKFIQKIYENVCLGPSINYTSFPLNNFVHQLQNLTYQLIVLDRNYGLESYTMENGFFKIGLSLDMRLYGDLLDFKEYLDPENINNQAFVRTLYGVFTIRTNDMIEINHIANIDSRGNENVIAGVYVYNNFAYLTFIENDFRISIGIVNVEYPRSIINFAIFDNDNVNINGQWAFIPGAMDMIYIRIDKEVLRNFTFSPMLPILNINSSNIDSLYTITAIDINLDSKNNTLKIKLTSDNTYEIILADNGIPCTKSLTIVNDYAITNGEILIPMNMFSGWNLTCRLVSIENDEYFANIIDKTPDKIEFFKSFNVSQDAQISYVDNYIVVIEEEYFNIFDFESGYTRRYDLPDVVGIVSVIDGNKQVFYVISGTYSCNCFMILFPSQIIIPITTSIKNCLFIEANINYLVISNNKILSIYTLIDQPEFLINFYLSEQKKLNINHISISLLSSLDTLLYIGTGNSIFTINLSTIGNSMLINSHKEIIYTTFVSGQKTVCVSSENKIIVFNNYLNIKILTLDINADYLTQLDDYVLASNNASLFIIDTQNQYTKNSVVFADIKNRKNIGLLYGKSDYAYLAFLENNQIHVYKINCLKRNTRWNNNVMLKADIINNNDTMNSAFSLNMNMRCWNEFSSKSTTIEVMFITYGNAISKKKDLSINLINDYKVEEIYDLCDYFNGFDMQAEIIWKGKAANSNNKNLPAYITPSLQKTKAHMIDENMIDHDVISFTNYTCILTATNNILLVNFETGNVDGNFTIIPKNNSTLKCININSISTIKSSSLIIVGCNYIDSSMQSSLKYSVLISLITDLDSKTLINSTETKIKPNAGFSKVIKGTRNIFVFAIIDGLANYTFNNNHIWIYKGIWDGISSIITFDQTVNYFTLNLNNFYAITLDGIYDYNNTLSLYVFDQNYGVRSLISYNGSKMIIKDSFNLNNPASSIGLCGKILFLGFNNTSIMLFKLIQNQIEYYMTYFPYNNHSEIYSALRGFISCDDYYFPKYIILPMKSNSMIVVRIINLLSGNASYIVRDIQVAKCSQIIPDFSEFIFLNSTFFLTLDTQLKYLNIFSIQKFSLVFPALSLAQCEKVNEKWGNEFEIEIKVYNSKNSVMTNKVFFDIFNGDDKDGKQNSQFLRWWEIVLIVVGFLIALTIIVFAVYFAVMKKRLRMTLFTSNLYISEISRI